MAGILSFSEYGVTASVQFDRWDDMRQARGQWTWTITLDDGVTETGSDLRGPASEVDALRTLGHFLSAFAEASDDGENADLFPASLKDIDFEAFCMGVEYALSPSDEIHPVG